MVAGKWAPVPPLLLFPAREVGDDDEEGGGGVEGGKMAAPEQNNTRTLTFSINLLTRV